jgi:hypothetical protein
MKSVYIAHRLLEEFGIADGKWRTEDEQLYQRLKQDSSKLLVTRDIPLPNIDEGGELLGYCLKSWCDIKDASFNSYTRILSQFTLTWMFAQKYKGTENQGLIPVLTSTLANCVSEESTSLNNFLRNLFYIGLSAVACYELLLLWRQIYT